MLLTFRGRAFVKIRLVGIVLSFRDIGCRVQGLAFRVCLSEVSELEPCALRAQDFWLGRLGVQGLSYPEALLYTS